jgi:hypothetical protein
MPKPLTVFQIKFEGARSRAIGQLVADLWVGAQVPIVIEYSPSDARVRTAEQVLRTER